MTIEDKKDITIKGAILGFILFVSMLINLLISKDMEHLLIVGTYLVPIIIGYGLLGMFIRWMRYRSTLRRKEFSLFSGPAILYWVEMLCIIFMVSAYFIPQVIRYIVLTNAAALFLIWYLDYLYLKNVAKELNSGLGYSRRILVEDLRSRPHSEDMFMDEIENYCKKNHLSLDVLEYGLPAKIKMNNTLYTVKLGQYYTLMGTIVYTLEFRNIVSK
ncbi:DUF4318 domain-containing protein [Clostridium swellfunianum]|uniref:DUF4318 domain-containing protein n=1 Tax=Clostridium swellfunianum TaxID=1367462 RepID=UPI00202F2080|nr:DUF4318 domain-containing protein [Clostridium swellfunianum]MCM0648068.1 DUF4318 domain-containing protein [Clostridium swellfunianum]